MIKNFLNISDATLPDLRKIIYNRIKHNKIKNKSIGLIFEKPSTRTRLSFQVGISQLNANPVDIKLDTLNLVRNESIEDTFRALGCYLDGIIYRTTSHNNLINASKYFNKPIINALSDFSHPCQIIGDLLTLYEQFRTLKLNILWVGDMNNVCYSLVEAVNIIDTIKLIIYTPSQISKNNIWPLSKNIIVTDKFKDLYLKDIDCVMTDVFVSMNDKGDNKSKILKKFQVNQEIMDKTSKRSVFMHCLPAKVGQEVTADVIKGKKSIVWRQAYNRMIAQKNLLQIIDW